jgi:hypothetical protein
MARRNVRSDAEHRSSGSTLSMPRLQVTLRASRSASLGVVAAPLRCSSIATKTTPSQRGAPAGEMDQYEPKGL